FLLVPAFGTGSAVGRSMYLDDLARTGLLMEIINILGNDRFDQPSSFQGRKRAMGSIGPCHCNLTSQGADPLIESFRVLTKTPYRCHSHRVNLLPNARLWRTKIRDA